MDKAFTLYGAAGSGSVPVEATLTLLGLPYALVEAPAWEKDAAVQATIARVNPMRQIPALVLPGGYVMTESAAILTWLADRHPGSGLAPGVDDAKRPAFLRWMSFVSASIYAHYWLRDDPSRLARTAEAQDYLLRRSTRRIADCWAMMDAQVSPGRYILGDTLTVLDLYVTVVSRFRPRRQVFYDRAPKMAEVVKRVDADPRLTAFWAERYPFDAGWDEASET
ncbi:MAG: glutathione S-transferase family protein [Caulobacteraceae bacterium]|nr:MAG: glutathione S-transferase family protein [Caulobacteraceae bacterium]